MTTVPSKWEWPCIPPLVQVNICTNQSRKLIVIKATSQSVECVDRFIWLRMYLFLPRATAMAGTGIQIWHNSRLWCDIYIEMLSSGYITLSSSSSLSHLSSPLTLNTKVLYTLRVTLIFRSIFFSFPRGATVETLIIYTLPYLTLPYNLTLQCSSVPAYCYLLLVSPLSMVISLVASLISVFLGAFRQFKTIQCSVQSPPLHSQWMEKCWLLNHHPWVRVCQTMPCWPRLH